MPAWGNRPTRDEIAAVVAISLTACASWVNGPSSICRGPASACAYLEVQ
jgi:hypothetical protein